VTKSPFTLSIEPREGEPPIQHGFHLGTDPELARNIAKEIFHSRVRARLPVLTVALMREGRLFDCYDGRSWSSDDDDYEQAAEAAARVADAKEGFDD
jgi:hypothetical protein